MKWILETQKGQDSLRAIIEQKEYNRLIEEVDDGPDGIKEFLKGEKKERLH
jgi:hypothetical protein